MLYNSNNNEITVRNTEQKRSKHESIESIKYFTYWITIKRVFSNIQTSFQRGFYHIFDDTDAKHKYVLGSGLTVDEAIESAYINTEVVRRLQALNNNNKE